MVDPVSVRAKTAQKDLRNNHAVKLTHWLSKKSHKNEKSLLRAQDM